MGQHAATPACHAVTFADTPAALCGVVGTFLAEALITQHVALVIATPTERASVLSELRRRHVAVDQAMAAGDLILLDAADGLITFMVNGMPDAALFDAYTSALMVRTLQHRKARPVRVFGGMVGELWKAGLTAAAIRLETLWNAVALREDLSLLCGYAMGAFDNETARSAILTQHSHLMTDHGAVWLANGPACPACGTPFEHEHGGTREDGVGRCRFCSVSLISVDEVPRRAVHVLRVPPTVDRAAP